MTKFVAIFDKQNFILSRLKRQVMSLLRTTNCGDIVNVIVLGVLVIGVKILALVIVMLSPIVYCDYCQFGTAAVRDYQLSIFSSPLCYVLVLALSAASQRSLVSEIRCTEFMLIFRLREKGAINWD